MSRPWGAQMPDWLVEAEKNMSEAQDNVVSAERRLLSVRGEMAGYASMKKRLDEMTLNEIVIEAERLGKDTSGSHDGMGRYLALLDEIEARKAGGTIVASTAYGEEAAV